MFVEVSAKHEQQGSNDGRRKQQWRITDSLTLCIYLSVSTIEGWLVYISIKDDDIDVRHVRREQSSQCKDGGANNFEVEWEISITFDKSVSHIKVTPPSMSYCTYYVKVSSLLFYLSFPLVG